MTEDGDGEAEPLVVVWSRIQEVLTKTITFRFDKSEPPAGSVGALSHQHKQVVCLNTFKKCPTSQRLAGKPDWGGSERRRYQGVPLVSAVSLRRPAALKQSEDTACQRWKEEAQK